MKLRLTVLILLAALAWTGHLHAGILLFPLLIAPLVLLALGLSWFLSAWGVFIKDMTQIVPVFVQMLLFLSPVFYPVGAVPAALRPFYQYNPLGVVIEISRAVVIGQPVEWNAWGIALVLCLVAAILGYALGEGANKLFETNRWDAELGAGFKSKSQAAGVIQQMRATFPRGYAYQNEVKQLTQRQGLLHNVHGFHRYFWDVMHRDGKTGETVPGEDAESCIAYNVQGDAHGHIKDVVLRLDAIGALSRFWLINIVHDSMVFEPLIADLLEMLDIVGAEMRKPSTIIRDEQLCPGGLVVNAEAKVGFDMANMMKPQDFIKLLGERPNI